MDDPLYDKHFYNIENYIKSLKSNDKDLINDSSKYID
jgi:hypothetical protein